MRPVSIISALILLHRTFRSLPAKARLHVFIRFWTAPLLQVAREVPRGALVLDLGAGHGAVAALVRGAGARRVVAVEPDSRKMIEKLIDVDCVIGYDDCIRGVFDAVVIVDVLYKIPIAEWDALLARVRARLRPGGVVIIKEQDPTARVKNSWNRLQEWLVSLAGLTLGESFSYEAPTDFLMRLERAGFTQPRARRIDLLYPHPHILYTARAAADR